MKAIPGYEGLYSATRDGKIWSHRNKRYLSPAIFKANAAEYHQVNLTDANGKHKTQYVHRLILLTFVGACPSGKESLHDDGNGLNNKLSNLQWGTHSENEKSKRNYGKNLKSKYSNKVLNDIRRRRKRGDTLAAIGLVYDMHHQQVHRICTTQLTGRI